MCDQVSLRRVVDSLMFLHIEVICVLVYNTIPRLISTADLLHCCSVQLEKLKSLINTYDSPTGSVVLQQATIQSIIEQGR